ncbi:MAG: hypothetical protein JEZ06_03270 [Anaerolineaceae bacterium]|nr:hypothetical protein [Anaerolineaceae bacterium]
MKQRAFDHICLKLVSSDVQVYTKILHYIVVIPTKVFPCWVGADFEIREVTVVCASAVRGY